MILRPLRYDAALFVAEHMRESDQREIYATRHDRNPRALAAEVAAIGPRAWVAGKGGAPIACIGAWEPWPGLWRVWMFATDDFRKIGFPLTRFVLRGMVPELEAAGARRAECYSIEGHDEAHRWLETLGAVREATLDDYGRNGEAFHVYRWRRRVGGD